MSKFALMQVVGMVFLIGGGQSLVRVVVDHSDRGFLGWLPGGFGGCLVGYVLVVVIGVVMAAMGEHRRRQPSS